MTQQLYTIQATSDKSKKMQWEFNKVKMPFYIVHTDKLRLIITPKWNLLLLSIKWEVNLAFKPRKGSHFLCHVTS